MYLTFLHAQVLSMYFLCTRNRDQTVNVYTNVYWYQNICLFSTNIINFVKFIDVPHIPYYKQFVYFDIFVVIFVQYTFCKDKLS